MGEAVGEAYREAGGNVTNVEELNEIDTQIEALQVSILTLNKQRTLRAIDAEKYTADSQKVIAKLDALFEERDRLSERQGDATLSEAYQDIVTKFLHKATEQAEFDKDIFTQLVDTIIIKNREQIIFKLKDGTELQADTDGIEY